MPKQKTLEQIVNEEQMEWCKRLTQNNKKGIESLAEAMAEMSNEMGITNTTWDEINTMTKIIEKMTRIERVALKQTIDTIQLIEDLKERNHELERCNKRIQRPKTKKKKMENKIHRKRKRNKTKKAR